MKLPFRYQFVLAPSVIVALLAGLVAYTLFELSNINHENEITRRWEILTDRIQAAIVGTHSLIEVIDERQATRMENDERFFAYLESASILSGSLHDVQQLSQVPATLRHDINQLLPLLREPEHVEPGLLKTRLTRLLPSLEHQYKIFAAQRRSATIDNHHRLVAISTRMTTLLLFVLVVCITLASVLSFWGLHGIRRRLGRLMQGAQTVCGSKLPAAIDRKQDELDQLEHCLLAMTERLLHVVGVENVLRGAETERRRIARDIHDGVLADLTAINRLIDKMNDNSAKTDELKTLRTHVDEVIGNLRCTLDDLHPQVLETLGLESALRSFLERHAGEGVTDVDVDFDPSIENLLSDEQKLNLFRMLTEALNNAIQHARGDRLELSLRRVADTLIASVEDNGRGMPEGAPVQGHGCANILERARLIGATAQWRASRFATGTCFTLSLNLDQTP